MHFIRDPFEKLAENLLKVQLQILSKRLSLFS